MKSSINIQARAPAKLILSGEHSVLYEQPAIAFAIDCYAESFVKLTNTKAVLFKLLNLGYSNSLHIQHLLKIKNKIQEKYSRFLSGNIQIKEVIEKPFELLQYTVSSLIERFNIQLSEGIEVKSYSTIPIGCGMGSSAAIIISTIGAIANLLNIKLDLNKFFSLGKEAENLQHGISSGIDVLLSLQGGCIYFKNNEKINCKVPEFRFFVVLTGKPDSSTGECVESVKKIFKNSLIKNDFGSVTEEMKSAIEENNIDKINLAIRENHKLLTRIGVVPKKVQKFIKLIENTGGCGKVCGAGTVAGDNAGVLLVMVEKDYLLKLVKKFNYEIKDVSPAYKGVHIV